jgi:hypothetical protein
VLAGGRGRGRGGGRGRAAARSETSSYAAGPPAAHGAPPRGADRDAAEALCRAGVPGPEHRQHLEHHRRGCASQIASRTMRLRLRLRWIYARQPCASASPALARAECAVRDAAPGNVEGSNLASLSHVFKSGACLPPARLPSASFSSARLANATLVSPLRPDER